MRNSVHVFRAFSKTFQPTIFARLAVLVFAYAYRHSTPRTFHADLHCLLAWLGLLARLGLACWLGLAWPAGSAWLALACFRLVRCTAAACVSLAGCCLLACVSLALFGLQGQGQKSPCFVAIFSDSSACLQRQGLALPCRSLSAS